MFGKLTFKDGEVEEKNFGAYRLIRMKEIPEIEAHFIDNGIDPTGLGEPALPPTGGAVANALFKATGVRLKNQPFIDEPLYSSDKKAFWREFAVKNLRVYAIYYARGTDYWNKARFINKQCLR